MPKSFIVSSGRVQPDEYIWEQKGQKTSTVHLSRPGDGDGVGGRVGPISCE